MAQNHTINNFNTQVVPLQLDGYRFCIVIFFMCKGKVSYLFKPHYQSFQGLYLSHLLPSGQGENMISVSYAKYISMLFTSLSGGSELTVSPVLGKYTFCQLPSQPPTTFFFRYYSTCLLPNANKKIILTFHQSYGFIWYLTCQDGLTGGEEQLCHTHRQYVNLQLHNFEINSGPDFCIF